MYEASESMTIGAAHQLILGVKPLGDIDSEGMTGVSETVGDIDEVDE